MWDVLTNSLFVDYSQISSSQLLAGVVNAGAELRLGFKTEGKDVSRSGWWDARWGVCKDDPSVRFLGKQEVASAGSCLQQLLLRSHV